MYSAGGVLRTTPSDKLRLVEPATQMPVLVPEDSLSGWRALKRCVATQPDLMFVRCAVPPAALAFTTAASLLGDTTKVIARIERIRVRLAGAWRTITRLPLHRSS